MTNHPHAGQTVLATGQPLDQAKAAMIMIHGRGASAHDILALSQHLPHPNFAYLAPQAAGHTWYPQRFIAPLAQNEPYLSSALQIITDILAKLQESGIGPEQTILMGFSQGACLSLEYVARNARRYGGVIAFSGGLIGPDSTPRDYPGSLEGTPIFIGCSDADFHIPLPRVKESTEVLTKLGATVDERIYPGMGHTINEDELAAAQALVDAVLTEAA